jgi:hypothetical protein
VFRRLKTRGAHSNADHEKNNKEFMVGNMTKSKIGLLAAAVALSGCAAMNAPAASVQRAVYVIDAPGATPMAMKAADKADGESKLMRIYWFLGGR